MKVPRYRIRADIEVTCYAYEGVDAVKSVLIAGQEMGTEDSPLKITLVAAPLYVLRIASLDRDAGFELINNAIAKMEEMIKAKKGALKVSTQPRVVSEKEKEEGEEDNSEDEEEEEDEESEEDESDDGEVMEPSKMEKKSRR